ncbi:MULTISPECIES: hypothetical protein [unclassified Pseudonocardia]|nr:MULTISPECIES: hypothetical protein [unclassified Pseudonocardia]
MSETNGLATSIGILAGVSVFVTGWIGMPTWLLFLAWLTTSSAAVVSRA